ncbi:MULTISPECIES: VOC family protein [unclassified Mesorhizobium]|uniref:VOC family protein n=1 Tax=unclassified Mesorhizobium TaxID=325217 RepID=UPI000FCAE858|nr:MULTISPECIES: VOC family protein [unclassified Mesorhizobium]TGP26745.1 glyoxalase [Mesorhizobium sp. M1D.F.Ca.ET.231.01.1.1]TGP38702.1 glyoxalase [Mesorhizobium sp. M1D.F.Ca.ET.234.01.1.1]TGS50911.1 glyoxalase [Mesorhizobium sp. M1D.F.Ca.ET.184.01.1.1]TGS66796.1 glyoxalase [Mesorhizobium sp. M1D.F.Ca.ET.183.01.1.1]
MISFVMFFARDIERTADVYRLLGFEFVQEQHGSGPKHLAAINEGMVLEIYPGDDAVSPGTMLGVDVADLEDIRARLLAAKVPVWRDIGSGPGVRRIIVIDPEKRQIFVRERARNN